MSTFPVVEMALLAKRWKNRINEDETLIRVSIYNIVLFLAILLTFLALKTSKETLSERQKRRPLVEIPRCLKQEMLEEAHQIVHKTLQSEGTRLSAAYLLHHHLTVCIIVYRV